MDGQWRPEGSEESTTSSSRKKIRVQQWATHGGSTEDGFGKVNSIIRKKGTNIRM